MTPSTILKPAAHAWIARLGLWIGLVALAGFTYPSTTTASAPCPLDPADAIAASSDPLARLRSTRRELAGPSRITGPVWQANPDRLILVVEADPAHVSLIDGERLQAVHRFASRNLIAQLPISPDGRYAYLAAADGWITRYDLWRLTATVELRIAQQLSALALSHDGQWLLAAGESPCVLVLLDADLNPHKRWMLVSRDAKTPTRALALFDAAGRSSFVFVGRDLPEIWEISYDPHAQDIHEGLVHDYRMGESLPTPGYLNLRRSDAGAAVAAIAPVPGFVHELIVTARSLEADSFIFNLDARRRVASWPAPDAPQLPGAMRLERSGRRLLVARRMRSQHLDLIDSENWRLLASTRLAGAGLSIQSHPASRFILADLTDSNTAGSIIVLDADRLHQVGTLELPGRTRLLHYGFTVDGAHILSLHAGRPGELRLYEAARQTLLSRLPLQTPTRFVLMPGQLVR